MPLPLRVLCSSPRPCACLIMPASDISRTIMQNTIIPAQMKHACLCRAPASCSPLHPSHCTPTLLHCLQDTTAQISMDRTCASLPLLPACQSTLLPVYLPHPALPARHNQAAVHEPCMYLFHPASLDGMPTFGAHLHVHPPTTLCS